MSFKATVAGGIISTVAAALIIAFFTDWFGLGGPPNRAIARVTAFTEYGNRLGQVPFAAITVENQGKQTAENCLVHWRPGMQGLIGPEEITTAAFALKSGQNRDFQLFSTIAWSRSGSTDGSAWVACSNTTSPPDVAHIFVF